MILKESQIVIIEKFTDPDYVIRPSTFEIMMGIIESSIKQLDQNSTFEFGIKRLFLPKFMATYQIRRILSENGYNVKLNVEKKDFLSYSDDEYIVEWI